MIDLNKANNFLVDAHCHIDLYKDPAGTINLAEQNRVYTIAVTNAPFVFKHTADLIGKCRYVRAAVGLHPELVATHGDQVGIVRSLLKQTRYVGEIGLDYTTADVGLRARQRAVLAQILGWCVDEKNKILTLHSRQASADVISMVGDSFDGKVILHWFSGKLKEVEQAANYGMFFSVNAAMTTSEKGKKLVAAMPVETVLTESDGPLAKIKGKPSLPTDVNLAVENLSAIWGVPTIEARRLIGETFRKLVGEDPQ
jgi:TatD DNase family protein